MEQETPTLAPICQGDTTMFWTEEQMAKALNKGGYSDKKDLKHNLTVLGKNVMEDGATINRCFGKLNQYLHITGSSLQLRPKM